MSAAQDQARRERADDVVTAVLRGIQQVVSFPGRSQYAGGPSGVSACGLAAFNCARVILGRERDGCEGRELLSAMVQREAMEEILDVCLRWLGSSHLDSEEIYEAPIFRRTLAYKSSEYNSPSFDNFRALLRSLQQVSEHGVAAIITRPPEIIAVLKVHCFPVDVFVLFDSHPRKAHPTGAGMIFNTSPDATARYLSDLLQFDRQLLEDKTLQWQAQLLANYSASIYVASDALAGGDAQLDAVLESSLAALALKAEVARLDAQARSFEAENRQLHDEVDMLESELRDLRREKAEKQHSPLRPSKPIKSSSSQHLTGGRSSTPRLASPLVPIIGSSSSFVPPSGKGKGRNVDATVEDDGLAYALQMQHEYEKEDQLLRTQRADLQSHAPSTFNCGICLDEQPEDDVARFDPCGHPFCRDCVRGHIRSKLGEHRFPVLCPVCAADKDTSTLRPGTVDGSMAQQIGLTDSEAELFHELEMAAFSVPFHCRKCGRDAFVDKTEYQEAKVVACPLPKCNYAWCKACSRELDFAGPPHSCDGSSELNHLMGQQGWKYCPGCKTPTEKVAGCNHMTCMSPGCNMHFCYVCGDEMIQSVRRADIRRAVSDHYRRCRLFEDVPDQPRRR